MNKYETGTYLLLRGQDVIGEGLPVAVQVLNRLEAEIGDLKTENSRLRDIERTTDAVTAAWARRCEHLEHERDRLLVLATKHCHGSHHDWDEILRIAHDKKLDSTGN